MPAKVDLTGLVFGQLTVVREDGQLSDGASLCRAWLCQCTCGQTVRVRGKHLTRKKNNVFSCGCYKAVPENNPNYKHGGKHTPEYEIWQNMKDRCTCNTDNGFKNYGARGITFCKRWKDFSKFLEDMGLRPSPKHTLDRVDNSKGYSKQNCRWATRKQQARNTRKTIMLEFQGETRALVDWAEHFGLRPAMVYMRYRAGFVGDQLFRKNEPGKRFRRKAHEVLS